MSRDGFVLWGRYGLDVVLNHRGGERRVGIEAPGLGLSFTAGDLIDPAGELIAAD